LVFICLLHDGQSPKEKDYKTIILPVVLCGFAAWSITLREEDRLLVLEDGVLEIFLPRVGKLTGFRKILHTESLHFSAGIT
jgi:hypothetical protein